MPTFRKQTEEEVERFESGGGTCKETKNQKDRAYGWFINYCCQKQGEEIPEGASVEIILEFGKKIFENNDETIGELWKTFWEEVEVDTKEEQPDGSVVTVKKRPKRKTAEHMRSHIKMSKPYSANE